MDMACIGILSSYAYQQQSIDGRVADSFLLQEILMQALLLLHYGYMSVFDLRKQSLLKLTQVWSFLAALTREPLSMSASV